MVRAEKPPIDFGSMIRRAREARGISLRQIAAVTKISVAVLEALERNDISRLPGGIFSRAFVRSYAVEVGLDPERTVCEFLEQFPHESVTAGSPHVPQEDHAAIESQRQSAQTAVTLIGISLPVVGAILYLTVWSSRPVAPAVAGRIASASEAAAAARGGEPLTFEVVATAPVTIAVHVDGVRRDSRLVAAGERLVFEAIREIALDMSDAAAVQLTINGQPAVALGPAGEPRTVQIGRGNFGSFLASR